MAARKTAAAAAITEKEAEREPAAVPEEPEQEPVTEPEQVPDPVPEETEQIRLVYIGPSLPYGKLRSSMVLSGTEEEIGTFLAEIKEQYPEVTHLLAPPDRLKDALEKVARKGTILHKYYEDMLAKSRASRT